MQFIKMRIIQSADFEQTLHACQKAFGCVLTRKRVNVWIVTFEEGDDLIIRDELIAVGSKYAGRWRLTSAARYGILFYDGNPGCGRASRPAVRVKSPLSREDFFMPRLRVELQPGKLELKRAGKLETFSRNPKPFTASWKLQGELPILNINLTQQRAASCEF